MKEHYEKLINNKDKPWGPEFNEAYLAIQKDVHETAKSKGWWDTERNDGEAIALMHSELSEAFDGWDESDDKVPEFNGMEAELADCVIRIMDMAEARGWNVANELTNPELYDETADVISIDRMLLHMHLGLSNALEAMRKPKKDEKQEIAAGLAYCVSAAMNVVCDFSYDVVSALCAKVEMNKTRERMHGGKKF